MRIEFLPGSDYASKFVKGPKPAHQYIPSWYKELPTPKESNIKYENGELQGLGLKACVPFVDALTTGYVQETWTDIRISSDNGVVNYGFESGPEIISHRRDVNVSIDSSYYPVEFTWRTQWRSKLPKGYSLLLTHPLNRLDLPFTTLSGVVDADHFHHVPIGNIPFFVHSNFDGIIPAGTPMFQIIPFKRDDWNSVVMPFDADETERKNLQIRRFIWGGYRKLFRQKKRYL